MDPQVVSNAPGKCPICGMPLTPVKKSSVRNSDDLELSEQQIKLGNIVIDTLQKSDIDKEIEFAGILNLDASQITSVTARVMGRVEKLYVKTTGDYVSKGAPLYEIYSDELNNAKQEYLAALQRRNLFKDVSHINFEDLIQSARVKLKLWGMSEAQIDALEKQKQASPTTTYYSTESGYVTTVNVSEGGYIMEGGTVVQLVDLSKLWAEAQIYTSQLFQVPRRASASVYVPGTNTHVAGQVEFVNPEVSLDSRINLLRVVIPNKGNVLKPGMSVLMRIRTASINSLTIPSDAIIRNANGAVVWIQVDKNKFRSQMVTTGIESDGVTEIISGLNENDAVVVRGAYLLHSEFIFKRGADPMSGHSH
jgi:Cu(I)/Ag(I) efflux system membrane fusion protein